MRHDASGSATRAGRANRDEVLRGRPHDVRASSVDGEFADGGVKRPPKLLVAKFDSGKG